METLAGLQRRSTAMGAHLLYLTVFSSFGIKICKEKKFLVLFPVILMSSPFPLLHRADACSVCLSASALPCALLQLPWKAVQKHRLGH